MPDVTTTERDVRQRSLVPPERLASCHAVVIGVGAIGRQVALQLAALGMKNLTLYDDDTVQNENLAPQGYWPEDLQRPKVHATADVCRCINPAIHVTSEGERFKRSTPRELAWRGEPIIFCCVDSIVARHMIWETTRSTASFFVDGRMSAEVLRVFAVDHPRIDDFYASTLFAAEETYVGACTAQSTICTASIAAGLIIHQFTRWLRRLTVDRNLTLNLLAAELTLNEPA